MSGVTTATLVVAGLSAAATLYAGEQQASAQKKANQQALAQAEKQEKSADEAMNRQNQKSTDLGAIMDAALMAGKGGGSGTMLTGANGVGAGKPTLGKSTLLGM